MEIEIELPQARIHPYLATLLDKDKVDNKNIYIISKDSKGQVIANPLWGGGVGWIVKNEDDFHPLPFGTTLTLKQRAT